MCWWEKSAVLICVQKNSSLFIFFHQGDEVNLLPNSVISFSSGVWHSSRRHRCCLHSPSAPALPRTANYPPTNFFTDNGTIKTLPLNNRFTGHWCSMTVGVKEPMNPQEQNYSLAAWTLFTVLVSERRRLITLCSRLTVLRTVYFPLLRHLGEEI